jgi:hypothetical protein
VEARKRSHTDWKRKKNNNTTTTIATTPSLYADDKIVYPKESIEKHLELIRILARLQDSSSHKSQL